jgi:xanthine/uracil permease
MHNLCVHPIALGLDVVGLAIFVVSVAAVAISVAAFEAGASASDKEWAQKLLTPLVSGVIAFVVGRASAK